MTIELNRIDERLLHGQVLVGWGARLGIGYYVIVDDPLATSEWEQELYASGAPRSTDVFFLSLEEGKKRFGELDARPDRGALLTRSTGSMRELAEASLLAGCRVNIGGIHAAPGRRRALDYVYLGDAEVTDLQAIRDLVRRISARDLPSSPEVSLQELIDACSRT